MPGGCPNRGWRRGSDDAIGLAAGRIDAFLAPRLEKTEKTGRRG